MRTKTLLVAGAALALSLATSQAQVYSANVVGYINVTVPAGGSMPVANGLINGSDANATNNSIAACYINGLISSPDLVTGYPNLDSNSVIYIWTGSTFDGYYYFNAADANTWNGTPTAGFYDLSGDFITDTVQQGQAAFIHNVNNLGNTAPMTLTLLGQVLQGTNVFTIVPGNNFISLAVPIDCTTNNPIGPTFGLPSNLTSTNLISGVNGGYPDPQLNDTIYVWSGTTWNGWYYFNAADANVWNGTPTAGFYDPSGDLLTSPGFPGPKISQGFFLWHSGTALQWTNSFIVSTNN